MEKLRLQSRVEVFEESLDSYLTDLAQEPAFVVEEYAEHLGDSEDYLAVRASGGYSAVRCILMLDSDSFQF